MTGIAQRVGIVVLMAAALSGCAAPPLKLYTLTRGPESVDDPPPLPRGATVIVVDRVRLPGYLDTQDILIRRGDVLDRSRTGRWVSRLSVSATGLLTAKLAMSRPDALVTDGEQTLVPDYEISVHVGELDVSGAGNAVMDADWEIIPRAGAERVVRGRIRIDLRGSVESDEGVVRLEDRLFERLAVRINLSNLR